MPVWDKPSRRWLAPEDERRVLAAIREAERMSSGEIRVHVDARCKGDPLEEARRWFAALGTSATAERNGVLLYFAVEDRKFAVAGDVGIHAAVGDEFWQALRDRLAERLREGRAGDGVVEAVLEIGRALAASFPRGAGDRNELPDDVSWGPAGREEDHNL